MKTGLVVALGERLYAVERPWGTLPAGLELGYVSAVAVDSQGSVYLSQRRDPPVVVFDPSGAYLRSWGAGVIADAHGISVAPGDTVLVVDRDAHQVLLFDREGTLELAIGERHRPRLQAPFNHPTDAAVAPGGDVYVSDGYGNSSVHRFSPDGELRLSWGRPGTGPGEFTTPHAIWIDGRGRVLVADRENDRVQLFSGEGEFLGEWGDFYHPMDVFADGDGTVYVTDQIPRLTALSPDGALRGRCRPVPYLPHGIAGDAQGNLYLAEPTPQDRLTKLTLLA